MVRLYSATTWITTLAISLVCGMGRLEGGTADPNRIFAELESLGACNVAGGAYVHLTAGRWGAVDMLSYDYTPSGNAWMLSDERDAKGERVKGTFVIDGGDLIELYWSEGAPTEKEDPFRAYGTWSPAQRQTDILLVTQFLRDSGADRLARVRLQRGRLLVFALHLHQQGNLEAAGRMVEELCRVGGGSEAVFTDGLNVLADAQYRRLYRRFLADRDWMEYAEGVKESMARYPQGWKSAAAMQTLLARITSRLSGPPSAPADVNGLSEIDLDLAARLTQIRAVQSRSRYSDPKVLWLIPSSWPADMAREGDADLEIRAKGMAGLPLLLALFNDDVLTEADARTIRGDSLIPRFEWSAGYSFDTLDRPATRGDVARRILLDVLPPGVTQTDVRPKSGADLFDSAREFHTKYRNATDAELAVLFLLRRYGSLNESAVSILLEAAKHGRVPALEGFLLDEGEYPDDRISDNVGEIAIRKGELFHRYTAIRGSEVVPLGAQLAAKLREHADAYQKPLYSRGSPEADRKHVEQVQGRIRQVAAGVEAIRYDTVFDDVLTRWLKARDSSNWTRLTTKLGTMPPSEATAVVLRKAAETDDPAGRMAMASVLRQISSTPDVNSTDSPYWAELWYALVTDDREVPGDSSSRVSDRFLCQYERLFADRRVVDPEGLIREYGASGRELLRRRVLGRLSGLSEGELPKYPQDAPLSDAVRAALREKLAAVASGERAIESLGDLSIYERAVLPLLLQGDPNLCARLLPAANTVVAVSAADAEPELQNRLMAWVGRPVTSGLVRQLQEYCKARGQVGRETFCLLARREYLGGCQVTVRADVGGQGGEIIGVNGLVCAPGVFATANWRLAPLPETVDWWIYQTSEPYVMEEFERALADVFGPGVEASSAVIVRFMTKGGVK